MSSSGDLASSASGSPASGSSGWESGEVHVNHHEADFLSGWDDKDQITLFELPTQIYEEILYKMDLTSKILMKETSVGMDEAMDRYISKDELQAFYAKLAEEYDEYTESARDFRLQQHMIFDENNFMWQWAAERAGGFEAEQHEVAKRLRSMRTYLLEKYPDLDLADWNSVDDFGSQSDSDDWDGLEIDLDDIDEYESNEEYGEADDEVYDDNDY